MRKYKVVGTQPILGHVPGTIFEASLLEDQEAFLIQIGGLKPVEKKAKPKDAYRR